MTTFLIVVAALAYGGSLLLQYLQNKAEEEFVSPVILGYACTAALAVLTFGTVLWMFTADMPRLLALATGAVCLGIEAWALSHRRDDLAVLRAAAQSRRDAALPPMPGQDTPAGPAAPDDAATSAPPDDGDDDDPRKSAAAFIVGDDAVTVERVNTRKRPSDAA